MIQNAGVVSALPTLASFGVVLSVGFVATLVIARRYATVTAVRKVVQVTGLAVAASLLIGVGYVPRSHVVAAVAMMVLAVGFMGLCLAGHHVNHIDIAPRFSSVLYVGKVGAECVPRCLTALCVRVCFVFCISGMAPPTRLPICQLSCRPLWRAKCWASTLALHSGATCFGYLLLCSSLGLPHGLRWHQASSSSIDRLVEPS